MKQNSTKTQLPKHIVMHCTYCGKLINGTVAYNEDAEPAHEQCVNDFEKHWEDRQEMMDLMGY
jgi:hypothetical protein